MNDSSVAVHQQGVTIDLSVEAAKAVAAVLGNVVDRTVGGFTESVYSALVNAGLSDGPFNVFLEVNEDYDPTDEDDWTHGIVLENQ